MSNPDDALDVVLKALGSAKPSVGFEARMHHALQQEQAPRRAWNMPWRLITAAWFVLFGVAMVMGRHPNYRRNPLVVSKPLPARHAVLPTVMQEVMIRPPEVISHPAKLVRVVAAPQPDSEPAMTHQNMPPPPLPLTQEERLVIRMMRHNDLPQLAALSSEARARSLHADAEEYRTFFAPRPPLNGQPYYDQHIYDQHTSGEAQ